MSISNVPGQGAGIYTPTTAAADGAAGVAGADKPKGSGIDKFDAKSYVASGGTEERQLLKTPEQGDKQHISSTSMAMVGMGEQDVGADMYAVMALFQKMAQEMRNSAREVRGAEMQSQITSLKDAAQNIRDAAQERMVGAIVSGSMQIVGGAMSLGMGIAGGAQQVKGGMKTIESAKFENQATNFAAMNKAEASPLTRAEVRTISADYKGMAGIAGGEAAIATGRGAQLTAIGQGSAGMFGGVGTIVQATQEKKAAEHDATKALNEADAKVHESGVQHANDLMQQMMDVIRDVRDKLGSIEQSRLETTRGIARNI
jgi:hypothetical protein